MSLLFDGSEDELTYEQALVLMAEQISWPKESTQVQVVTAIRKAKNLALPEPDLPPTMDDRDKAIRAQDQVIEAMQRELAQLRKTEELRQELETARARAAAGDPTKAPPAHDVDAQAAHDGAAINLGTTEV
jgi:hypothetical protein